MFRWTHKAIAVISAIALAATVTPISAQDAPKPSSDQNAQQPGFVLKVNA
jgi:hypothetical protein